MSKLPTNIKSTLKKTTYLTKNNKKILVNLAINYGSKNEILNAFKITKKKVTIKKFEKNLYTKNIPNPDLLIRTGGHKRLSNFMLWQLAYAELYFLRKLWPEFNTIDLNNDGLKEFFLLGSREDGRGRSRSDFSTMFIFTTAKRMISLLSGETVKEQINMIM